MNTSKYNIEQQIKKQIDEREITPSRDLWAEIEVQKASKKPANARMNWFLAAACLALILSLGIILISNNDEVPQPQMAETKTQPENIRAEKNLKTESSFLAEKTETLSTENKVAVSTPEAKFARSEITAKKSEAPLIKEKQEQIISGITQIQISSSIAKIDSAKIPVKRKKFVDPSTLLFSVEHKDVIENSKDGSNVATIDLNSK
ncbi:MULTISPECIES: hypothetical protein [Chryseobacterium]|uniref:Uncharacterized protein n=1 Tax=Chryseobacterium salivictor TaxID=2547600 RepID=A0A4V1AKY3_9FLAO|nr:MULTISPECIES: hypothetical protein [Chryseobacterium]MDQ0476750.1 hypothetical protein [Chryseobacterium sp. MDT2-18]QBO57864.1 hypothetical protein NBC122_01035 [Chryseobacterium salivictor]